MLPKNTKGLNMSHATAANRCAHASQEAFSVHLPHQAIFSIADVANMRIACAQGSVWITLDHDLRDIVLDDCQTFSTTEHRRAVVYAMKPSQVNIVPAAPVPSNVPNHRHAPAWVLRMQPA